MNDAEEGGNQANLRIRSMSFAGKRVQWVENSEHDARFVEENRYIAKLLLDVIITILFIGGKSLNRRSTL